MTENITNQYSNYFLDMFQYPEYLMGKLFANEPDIVNFNNGREAAELLYKHLMKNSNIGIHTDVDMDGVGSCYILRNWLLSQFTHLQLPYYINGLKIHGMTEDYIEKLNSQNLDLLIILDSSTNDINLLKNLNCDCLVIDHHEILITKEEMLGETASGRYVVVNSMASNDGYYSGCDTMSAGLTVYEFLRYFQYMYHLPDNLDSLKLYQWAVITLFTDYMNNDNLRNIYYIQKVKSDTNKEPGLAQMLESVSCYSYNLSKSDIGFTLGPLFNRAIRAGYSGLALSIALTNPKKAVDLQYFRSIQDEMTKDYADGAVVHDKYVTKCLTDKSYANYAGLIAMKLLDKYSKTAIVYSDLGNGYVGGSFRGFSEQVDYRKILYDKGYFAQGHKSAFGFKLPKDKVDEIMLDLVSNENTISRDYLTAGSCIIKGVHHIDDILDFQRNQYLWYLGNINSYMATNLNIIISTAELEYISVNNAHTCYTYEFNGIKLIAFEQITTPQAYIYIEYQDGLRMYVKNRYTK